MKIAKDKTIATAISLFLILAMAVSLLAIPIVNAQQDLIMNVSGLTIIHAEVDIDLNGGPGPFENVSLWIKYPGRADFTYIDTYLTRSNGDLDVYDFDFNETGIFQLKWAYPPDSPYYPGESNVADVEVVTEIIRPTYAYIGATPNPVGVGQETLLHVGITQQLALVQMGWEGITVTVTRPDLTSETLGPFRTDSTGGTGTLYVPGVEGTYKLQTHFPEQKTTATNYGPTVAEGTRMLASDSRILELVVTAEQQPIYPANPLPTEYWTRPIDNQLREWAPISGSWWGFDARGNDDAPTTAHILWNKPLMLGGLAGGIRGPAGTYTGDAYEGKFDYRTTIQGILFYLKYDTIGGNNVENWCVAVDLRTGETLWERELLTPEGYRRYPEFGQIMEWDSFNTHGTWAYLWGDQGSRWDAFDPHSGRWLFTMTGVPSGTELIGPSGEFIIYSHSTSRDTLQMWNSSAVIDLYWGDNPNAPGWGSWRPQGKNVDATGPCDVTVSTPLGENGVQWRVDVPDGLSGAYQYAIDDKIVGSYMDGQGYFGGTIGVTQITHWALSTKKGSEGTLLYKKTWNAPTDWATGSKSITRAVGSIEDGLIAYWCKETQQYWGFSTDTGDFLWGPTEPQNYLDYLAVRDYVSHGRLFSQCMSGIMHCYNATTGELLWTYSADDPYNQVLWANQWHIRPLFIAGGKIYMGTTEHSPVDPLTRGGPFCAVDIETGEEVFRVNGLFRQTDWGGRAVIGDSIIGTMDTYDLQVYGIGKGPSATTVTAPDIGVPLGKSVLLKGMVTDVSPGTKAFARTARFPDGVPAVSDASMSDWMLYVYKQFARPADATGVEVVLEVLDPNNNYYEVGRTTSDSSGFYSAVFTPEVPGKYTVIASFRGSGGYYGSFAETAVYVEEAPQPTPAPTPTPAPMTDTYVMGFGIGIIIAIVVVGLLLFLMFRRR